MTATWLGTLTTFGWEVRQGLLQLLYPNACGVCRCPLPPDLSDLCTDCRKALTTDPYPSCPRCAATVGPFIQLDAGCPGCRDHVFHFDRAVRLGPYDGLLRQVILRLKYSPGEGLAEMLGRVWATHAETAVRETGVEMLVPVPLHWQRRWSRGYNQSAALAHALAAHLHLPCHPGWLRRLRNTPGQVEQTATARRDNVRGAFYAPSRPELSGKTVLLVDDVVTTGSTASEAARALRTAGAARVVLAVLAHSQSGRAPARMGPLQ